MDGFAIRGTSEFYTIKAKQMAGQLQSIQAADGDCVYVTTGAAVPEGFDTVIPIEDVT